MRYRETRLPSGNELRIEYGPHVARVELVNVSSSGAQITLTGPLTQDALVTLCQLHLRFPARVVWSEDARTGVRFVRPLSAADVTALRGAMGARGWGSSGQQGFRELS